MCWLPAFSGLPLRSDTGEVSAFIAETLAYILSSPMEPLCSWNSLRYFSVSDMMEPTRSGSMEFT